MRTRCVGAVMAGLLLTMCLPAHAIVLRYRPKVGKAVKHNVNISHDIQGPIGDKWPSRGYWHRSTFLAYQVKALSATEETTRVETRLTKAHQVRVETTRPFGDPDAIQKSWDRVVLKDLPEGPIVMDLSQRGHAVKLVSGEFGGGEAEVVRALEADEFCTVPAAYCILPKGEVGINDTWSLERKVILLLLDQSERTLRIDSKLLALTTYQGRNCAKVHTEFALSPDRDGGAASTPDREAGRKAEAAPKCQGYLDWYYDYENSVYSIEVGYRKIETPTGSMETWLSVTLAD